MYRDSHYHKPPNLTGNEQEEDHQQLCKSYYPFSQQHMPLDLWLHQLAQHTDYIVLKKIQQIDPTIHLTCFHQICHT